MIVMYFVFNTCPN